MRISFSPQRRNDKLILSKAGDVLTLNGDAFDFTTLPDGATIPSGTIPSDWFVGSVDRVGGELQLTLLLPHGPKPSHAVAFPDPVTVTVDGPVAVPQDVGGADVGA